jgi:hypothetical protein
LKEIKISLIIIVEALQLMDLALKFLLTLLNDIWAEMMKDRDIANLD